MGARAREGSGARAQLRGRRFRFAVVVAALESPRSAALRAVKWRRHLGERLPVITAEGAGVVAPFGLAPLSPMKDEYRDGWLPQKRSAGEDIIHATARRASYRCDHATC